MPKGDRRQQILEAFATMLESSPGSRITTAALAGQLGVSEAAVKLTTGAFAALKSDPTIGRAEALRRSMLALIDKGAPYERHPAYWAPFIVVGEGG